MGLTVCEANCRLRSGLRPKEAQAVAKKQISPKLKLQVVLEVLSGERSPGQIAKKYGVHPNSVGVWRKQLLERGSENFAQYNAVQEYERRLADLEQLLGKKEVEPPPRSLAEIALLKSSLGRNG